ncbi:hypothetical protein MSAN_01724200 [Mycena sanguinolenta]|uniref:Uncharacterized protein n=1 Tax=Mycena sanguinolenta TaxID=230812 RepID=A0A8H7CVB5_9AGAR|nr:hypothetical protein MSAN_01724200 [Mycena sanguinolenta]
MTTFESALYYANPGEERLRLWRKEKTPEIELKFKDMQRDINADLGARVREILHRPTYDHSVVLNLCKSAEEEEKELSRLLHEGVEAEAARLKTSFMHAALNHPDASIRDPTQEVRDRISGDPQAENRYCSPVLVETLLWEGMDELPNTHRQRLELDFPDRVEALLDFHCIAFHADVNVLKEFYDEDVLRKKENKHAVLARHQAKMHALMVTFAREMNERWAEQKGRLQMKAAQGPPTEPPVQREANDGMIGIIGRLPPPQNPVACGRRRAHITDDPPTILEAVNQSKPAQALPPRGILKNASSGARASVAKNSGTGPFNESRTVAIESLTFDDGDESDTDFPDSFFLDKIITGESAEEELKGSGQYLRPEVADFPLHASTSRSYEFYRPPVAHDITRTIPRALNAAQLTQRFEGTAASGKGKGKATSGN